MTTTSVKIDKYTIQHEDGANVRVLCNNKRWMEGSSHIGEKMLIAVADEIETLRYIVNFTVLEPALNEIESALRTKKEQPVQNATEPVAWAIFAGNGNMRLWSRKESYAQAQGDELGLPLVPLFKHPVTTIAQPVQPSLTEASRDSAVDTLLKMGYTYFGKEEWKPPAAQVTNGTFCDIFRNGCKECSHGKKSSADNKKWKADVKYGNEIVSTMAARRSATPCQPLTHSQVQKIVMEVCDTIYPQDNTSYSEADSVFYSAFVHAIEVAHNIKHAAHSKETK